MQPPNGYGQQPQQRQYRDPRNDPANWSRGGMSMPMGQIAGNPYQRPAQMQQPSQRPNQQPMPNPYAGLQVPGVVGQAQAPSPFSGYMGPTPSSLSSPMGVTGRQNQVRPPVQQIQPMQPPQQMTQQFPMNNPWQQRVPQNFNQGSMYDQFSQRW